MQSSFYAKFFGTASFSLFAVLLAADSQGSWLVQALHEPEDVHGQ